jgi:hypothetical protein
MTDGTGPEQTDPYRDYPTADVLVQVSRLTAYREAVQAEIDQAEASVSARVLATYAEDPLAASRRGDAVHPRVDVRAGRTRPYVADRAAFAGWVEATHPEQVTYHARLTAPAYERLLALATGAETPEQYAAAAAPVLESLALTADREVSPAYEASLIQGLLYRVVRTAGARDADWLATAAVVPETQPPAEEDTWVLEEYDPASAELVRIVVPGIRGQRQDPKPVLVVKPTLKAARGWLETQGYITGGRPALPMTAVPGPTAKQVAEGVAGR